MVVKRFFLGLFLASTAFLLAQQQGKVITPVVDQEFDDFFEQSFASEIEPVKSVLSDKQIKNIMRYNQNPARNTMNDLGFPFHYTAYGDWPNHGEWPSYGGYQYPDSYGVYFGW